MSPADTASQTIQRAAGLRSRARAWKLLAVAVVALGAAMTLVGGLLVRSSAQKVDQQAFQSTAADITTNLATLLRRDADFVATARGVLTMQPDLSPTGFDSWFRALGGKRQQAGSLGTAVIRAVPAPRLDEFLARRNRDASFRALVGSPAPVARESQSRYCLLAAGSQLVPVVRGLLRIAQADWCYTGSLVGSYEAPLLRAATDSGRSLALSPTQDAGASGDSGVLDVLGGPLMMLETPFYEAGAPLRTVAQRRAAVRGWTLSAFDVTKVIGSAIGQNRGFSVAVSHRNPGQPWQQIAVAGAPLGADHLTQTRTVNIEGPWSVQVRGRPPVTGLSVGAQTWLTVAGGAIVTALLFLLVVVLSRSRERALLMVTEKTGQLRHQALHDALTGLPNRVLVLDRAEQMLARARRLRLPIAALYIDIDGFKHINDTFGHGAGDEFLGLVADRISAIVRDSDTAGRMSGDEFVVLLDATTILDAGPDLVAERLMEVLREPYDLNGHVQRQVSMTASIGLAHGMDGTPEELLADADLALHEAKGRGKDRVVVFQSGMQTAAQDRVTLEMDLGEALAQEQLFLMYQPTFDLETERTVGFEALLRWQHPTRGLIPPGAFIPIAEDSGAIVAIGRWVLDQACEQAARWRAAGHDLRMSVNVSARQLDRDDLIDHVREALARTGMDPALLTLEITETTLMRDAEAATVRLASLKRLGVRIAIDDFGTGYSSLAYLRQFPVDSLKIDRSFVSGMARSKQSSALIHTLVRLGKSLDIETLAEGIEDREQLEALQAQHCDKGQGFLFAKPLDVDSVGPFLAAEGERAVAVGPARRF